MSKYVVESGSSSSGATSKRPYDAMVYKDADSGYTIAVDGNGNVIKKVLSSLRTDNVAILAAIEHIGASGGKLFLGNTSNATIAAFIIDATIHIASYAGLKIEGSGITSTTLFLDDGADCDIFHFTDCNTLTLCGFTVNANKFNNTLGTAIKIDVSSTSSWGNELFELAVLNASDDGIYLGTNVATTNISNTILEANEGWGINGENSYWIKISNIWGEFHGGDGCISIGRSSIVDNVEANNCKVGVKVCNRTCIVSNVFQTNETLAGTGVYIDTLATEALVRNVHFIGAFAGNTGINVLADNCSISGCALTGYGTVRLTTGIIPLAGTMISDCVFKYCTTAVSSPSSGVVISGNNFEDCTTCVSTPGTNIINDNLGYNPTITLVVGNPPCDYATVAAALNAITDNGPSKEYCIVLNGNVTESSLIIWKSYVHLDGKGYILNVDVSSNGYGITLNDLTHARFDNVTVTRNGTVTAGSCPIGINGTSDSTVVFNNVNVINQITSAVTYCNGINIFGYSTPIIKDSSFTGGGGSTSSYGMWIYGNASPMILTSTCTGGAGGSYGRGIVTAESASPKIISCHGIGGDGGQYSYGIRCEGNSSPTIVGSVGLPGIGGTTCFGISSSDASSPYISNCSAMYRTYTSYHSFTGSNATIQPFAGKPYFPVSMYVSVTVAGAGGSTLNIGTSLAGTEIASGVPTSSTGSKYFTISRPAIVADSPIYLTFSDTNTRATIYYIVGYNLASSYGVSIDTYGYARFSNCKFYSDQASSAGYISTTARTAGKFLIENCSFESVGTYDLEGQTSGVVPVYNCTFGRGSLSNITIPGKGTGAKITAGNTNVDVTHGLNGTPTTVRVTPTTNLAGLSFWVDTKGATTFRINISAGAGSDHTFDWEAEV